MKRESKIWGERWGIRQDSTHATSYLRLEAGHRCSFHSHQTKYNLFVVLFGKIGIVTNEIEDTKRLVVLTEGQSFTTRPGQLHEFRVYENSGVIEEMYVEYDESDIDRLYQGSRLSKEEML